MVGFQSVCRRSIHGKNFDDNQAVEPRVVRAIYLARGSAPIARDLVWTELCRRKEAA
jgi:hypothetical protein